jgi:hypothetical protein
MFKKAMSMVAGLCLVVGGGFFSYKGHRLTVSLFLHYLQGSGEAVTLELPSFLDKYCQKGPGIRSTHSSEWGYAFGRLTCTEDGAYDLYDFNYEGRPTVCRKLKRWTYGRMYTSPERFWGQVIEAPADVGRCLVGLGYGKPFEVYITK